LIERERAGLVRRCHGDLHLGNICLLDGEPTLFDAIEFNDAFAWIDVLHDLAFLLMDMEHRDMRGLANIVFNGYLAQAPQDEGLAALPVFLADRAMVRAKVAATTAAAEPPPAPERVAELRREGAAYLAAAQAYLRPAAPCLVAVGGVSGSGKSTLAARLAPGVGPAPGAVHLRSDVERKRLFGVADTDRLPEAAYAPEVGRRVFERLFERAAEVLAAGHAVVVDAVFGDLRQREDAAAVARRAGVPFRPIWLEARQEALMARVAARRGDASDATPAIVARQLEARFAAPEWPHLSGDGTPDAVAAAACALLAPDRPDGG
ncbi:MAG: AAA family ATPase, partial [Alphaproteobacteria bacterium]